MSESSGRTHFFAPRFWGVHIGFFLLRVFSLLPWRSQLRIGRRLGRIGYRLAKTRRRIANRNLRLCFPEMTDQERTELTRLHFENLGMAVAEMGMAYYRPQRLVGRFHWHGDEHLDAHIPGSVILLTAHFGALEVGGTALRARGMAFDAVYREDNNPLMNQLIRRGRERAGRKTIEKANIKAMVRSLREDVPVWYAPDQSYRRKHSELLPFFNVPTMTNTATGALARLGKAKVIGFFPHRRPDFGGYDIYVHPPLDGFPGDDAVTDTLRITYMFEQEIKRSPAQYYWVHRKFKNRPAELPDLYADLADEDEPAAS